jgi:hypothetical protein
MTPSKEEEFYYYYYYYYYYYWSLTLREEYRLRVFGIRVLRRRIVGPKKDEVTGEWRNVHNKNFYALYSSPNIIRVIKPRRLRWAGYVAWMRTGQVHAGF